MSDVTRVKSDKSTIDGLKAVDQNFDWFHHFFLFRQTKFLDDARNDDEK